MTTTSDKTVLLTGFEAFGEFGVNPSALVAETLTGETLGNRIITGRVLPVVFGEAGDTLIAAIEDIRPQWVICMGLAATRETVSIERLAVNLDDTDIPDNAGNSPVDSIIAADGPVAYWSTLPVKTLMSVMQEENIPASLSSSAGNYVCNHVFYRLLHHLASRPGIRGGFVHVPPLAGQTSGIEGIEADTLMHGIRELIRAIPEQPD